MALSAKEPKKKKRKGDPQQAGDTDDQELLLSAMEVVVKAFLGVEKDMIKSSENDKDEEESKDEESNKDEDDASDASSKSSAKVDGCVTGIDVLKTLRATGKRFKALVDAEMDRRLEEKIMPDLEDNHSNICGNSFSLELLLSAGLDKYPQQEMIIEKCREFIDPESHETLCDKDNFDYKGAEKALRKDGSIGNVFKFDTESSHDSDDTWSVEFKCDEEITDNAFEELESLLVDGSGFRYPSEYDSFGVNEFEERFNAEEFAKLKEQLWFILCRAKSVKHSYWEGDYEFYDNGVSDTIREEFFAFSTHGGGNFVLEFRHALEN